ncbi:peptidoglycan-binding protein [Loktanella sp. D2R18]|nr:peptidoglycan-binding protein [Loktanella sp. D2R18]
MVIAGRADPGQEIAIMLGGTELERVTADGAGNFVALPMAGVSDTPRSLTLVADPDAAALRSETSYIVAPIAAPAPVVAQLAVPELPNQIAAPQAPTAAPTQTSSATQPAAPAAPAAPEVAAAPIAAPERPAAPTVLQADAQGVRVVQSGPELPAPNVGLDAITYDPEGEVQLSGRAVGDGAVQIYLDNEPVTTSPVTEGGDWQIDLPEIETGIYTLRVDEVDNAGDVVSRLETPFKREEAADVAAVLAEETGADGFEVAVRTVQPGATLWAIAEESLGNGVYYVQVYEANSDLIRDPDLIYPGQIFRMPEVSQ